MDRRHTQLTDHFVALDLRQMKIARHYNDWIARQVLSHCGRRVLEIGAGIGNITSHLVERADYVCALEPNETCFKHLRRELGAISRFECRPWRLEDCDHEFVRRRAIDTIVCVNVLEHIEDDASALKRLHAWLHPQIGRLVLVVPAVPAAYGSIDAALGHHRRYSRGQLRSTLVDAGFSIRSLRYSNVIGLLGWFFNAHVGRRVQQSDRQIWIFDTLVVPWSSRLEHAFPPPVGLSLIAAADAGH